MERVDRDNGPAERAARADARVLRGGRNDQPGDCDDDGDEGGVGVVDVLLHHGGRGDG